MREILFRGKTQKGEWVYGYYVPYGIEPHQCEAQEYFHCKELHTIISCVPMGGMYDMPHLDLTFNLVLPETVGQYIGLKDVEGNKIFEGDIVWVVDPNHKYHKIVRWSKVYGAWVIDDIKKELYFSYTEFASQCARKIRKAKIIDTIHDNPELLVGDK